MANTAVKLICVDKENYHGNGWASIMANKDKAIDITEYAHEWTLSDSTIVNQPTKVVVEGVVYTCIREYYDLTSKTIYVLARHYDERSDIWPIPEKT